MKNRFWPFDLDQDEAIYDNVTWDLPGVRKSARRRLRNKAPRQRSRRPGK